MQKLMAWAVLFSGISTSALAQPVSIQDQQQWLLEQVRIGEALYRDDLVRDSLARLWLIAPDNPQALAAWPRLCLHASMLSFTHPQTGERLRFECPAPF